MARKQLKVVKLIEPDLCMECRFAVLTNVVNPEGSDQTLIRCRRLDCDNWDVQTAEDADEYHFDEAA